jgi:hypothetical protein
MATLTNGLSGLFNWAASNPVQNFSFQGKLVDESNKLPLANFSAKIYARNYLGFSHLVSIIKTNGEGEFNLNYDWIPSRLSDKHFVTLELLGKKRDYQVPGLIGPTIEYPLQKIQVVFDNSTLGKNDLGQRNVKLDNISLDISQVKSPLPNDYPSPYYFWRLISAATPIALKAAFSSLFGRFLTTSKVQSVFNVFAKQYPKVAPTPDHLLDELKNKICAVAYIKLENGDITWEANWDEFEFDTPRSLPNVRVVAERSLAGLLTLKAIDIKYREDGEPRVINLVDKEQMEWAIYIARSVFALKGEIDIHLGEGHLLPGITARHFFKTIQVENPLYDGVARYLTGLDFINDLGSRGLIFGDDSIVSNSPLTEKDSIAILNKHIHAKANYMLAQPQEPVDDLHERARVANVHYTLLLEHFRKFIQENNDGLKEHLDEIYSWSESMHLYLDKIPKIIPEKGVFGDQEKENLALCLAALVNQTTYLHWSAHSSQGLLTHVDSASLYMRDYALKDGKLEPFGNTPPDNAITQLKIALTLLNFKSLLFKDIAHPDLLALITKNKDKYPPHVLEEMFGTTEI